MTYSARQPPSMLKVGVWPERVTRPPATRGWMDFVRSSGYALPGFLVARRDRMSVPGSGQDAEQRRLADADGSGVPWRRWGPYLSERQWGTVREDYSGNGDAWSYFSHDQARSRAYRWGEDGIAGVSDDGQRLCLALALWNGRDPLLKERMFGLTNTEGNHGEDVKEYYFYLDSTPTHSYLKFLYKYPQAEFPYGDLAAANRARGRGDFEYELLDTGVFADDRYFDVFVEYAKAAPEDLLVQITVHNRGPEEAVLHLLPTLWFRHTWSWAGGGAVPSLRQVAGPAGLAAVRAEHEELGVRWLYCDGGVPVLFTGNETNNERIFGTANDSPYVKDGIDRYVVHGEAAAVNPERTGTKAAAHHVLTVPGGQSATVRLRLAEADAFYAGIAAPGMSADQRRVVRQALAGMLWSKQYYGYDVERWLAEHGVDPLGADPRVRNSGWYHLVAGEIISMPDTWEYPWFAAWDLAFHAIALSTVDSAFAKDQLGVLLRRLYLHPNGQIPAYEWNFGDVNPPVHAWATLFVYELEKLHTGQGDRAFLENAFGKLMKNFVWWLNRKDPDGRNVFQGGFLGLDNIGVFDRRAPLPTGGHIDQSDGTSWMGMYCLNMLAMALELAREDPAYEDVASKFFEHFVYIAHATRNRGGTGIGLWDEQDGFFYDVLHSPDGRNCPLKLRSIVGLIPLFAVEMLDPDIVERLHGFRRRMQWFIDHHPDFREHVEIVEEPGRGTRRMLSIMTREQLPRVLRFMLDESEFLSPYGIRALSRYHLAHPYALEIDGMEHRVDYEPGESTSGLFGGNSNWRGPVWFPVNQLLIESLQKFHHFYGDSLKVPYPTGSDRLVDLRTVSAELAGRLTRIFLRGSDGRRPVFGATEKFQRDSHWQDLVLFYEYFHGDTGAGIGASHQTGWTGLVAKLIHQSGR